MKFVDRQAEMGRLDGLAAKRRGGLGVVWGRRRVGKSRLLLEWCRKHRGLYTVADRSSASIQRGYFARAAAEAIRGFDGVVYPDWRTLLGRLAAEARACGWRGPLVLDELPYWVETSPELPSVLQHWVDNDAAEAGLTVVVAGSAQAMMQGLVLDASAPLFGRAAELIEMKPLAAGHLPDALGVADPVEAVRAYSVWGGIPRYWELAADVRGGLDEAVDRLVLDPMGPLHLEPDRLLMEELPPAVTIRPLLDAIGFGAHRLTEIAGRIGQPATSLGRALARLQGMGLIERQLPYGESEKSSKRACYRIHDPFFRFWFKTVAPHRALLAAARPSSRRALWHRLCGALVAETWEDLCRQCVPRLDVAGSAAGRGGCAPWSVAGRYWHGNGPEWDVVARSVDGARLLVGEVKWGGGDPEGAVRAATRDLAGKGVPPISGLDPRGVDIVRVVFMAGAPPRAAIPAGTHVVDARQVLAALR